VKSCAPDIGIYCLDFLLWMKANNWILFWDLWKSALEEGCVHIAILETGVKIGFSWPIRSFQETIFNSTSKILNQWWLGTISIRMFET
jgi:hypothetical protein